MRDETLGSSMEGTTFSIGSDNIGSGDRFPIPPSSDPPSDVAEAAEQSLRPCVGSTTDGDAVAFDWITRCRSGFATMA